MSLKKWTCFVCNEDVIEGQKFTFLSGKAVHLHCLERYVVDKLAGDFSKLREALAILRALDVSATALVGYKTIKLALKEGPLRDLIEKLQRDEERISSILTGEIERLIS